MGTLRRIYGVLVGEYRERETALFAVLCVWIKRFRVKVGQGVAV